MKDNEDSSSNDEAAGEEAPTESNKNIHQDISKLLLDVVERLTKISVLCESRTTADSSSVKSLIKYMHKFERDLRKLQSLSQHLTDGSDTIYKGAIRAVDNYQNPYDWAYKNIVQQYEHAGKRLDYSLDAVDTLQKELIERFQVNKLLDPATEAADTH